MPEITFSKDSIEKNVRDVPVFKLQKVGDVAVMTILDTRPVGLKLHWLNSPADSEIKFTGKYQCLGADCPMCELATDGRGDERPPVGKVSQRYLMRVGVYTNSGMELQLWDMTSKTFEKIVTQIEFHEIDPKELPGLDVAVKCEKEPPYVVYDLAVSPKARRYTKSDAGKLAWEKLNAEAFTLAEFEASQFRDATSEQIHEYCDIIRGNAPAPELSPATEEALKELFD